jgi:hypothetical protein
MALHHGATANTIARIDRTIVTFLPLGPCNTLHSEYDAAACQLRKIPGHRLSFAIDFFRSFHRDDLRRDGLPSLVRDLRGGAAMREAA